VVGCLPGAAGVIPVVEALLGKGAALGSVLAFMMSVIAFSLPEMVILRKVLKPKLIAVFVGVDATVEKITDMMQIASYGVFGTPSVIVDGDVKCTGKVPKKDDIKKWLGK